MVFVPGLHDLADALVFSATDCDPFYRDSSGVDADGADGDDETAEVTDSKSFYASQEGGRRDGRHVGFLVPCFFRKRF